MSLKRCLGLDGEKEKNLGKKEERRGDLEEHWEKLRNIFDGFIHSNYLIINVD